MGARAVSLYLAESPMKRFFALGSDYAWGRDSVGSFSEQITAAKKEVVGKDYPPVGTKDFASYIAKIRQSRAEGVLPRPAPARTPRSSSSRPTSSA